ncbi:MAG: hypothetical protein LLF94_00575 [Chlamydiales bacterium]|nr:hypothetical protein [Chlamydiales bacterium]
MKKHVFFASLLFVGTLATANADVSMAADGAMKTSVSISQGYRNDNLKLKGRSGGSDKLHFKNIDTYTTRLGVLVEKDQYFMKGIVGYGDVYDGKVHAHGNGHHGHRKVKGDYTADFDFKVGKQYLLENDWAVAPTLGYGVYLQDFHGKKHHGHRAKLKATWYSPQIGVCVKKSFNAEWNAYLSYNFFYPVNCQVTSYGGNSHSRDRRENQAYKSVGNIGTIGAEWIFAKNWSLKPEIEVMKFYSKGGNSSHGNTNHSKVTRSAAEYRLVLNYIF